MSMIAHFIFNIAAVTTGIAGLQQFVRIVDVICESSILPALLALFERILEP